jgi:hypothetical protein
MGCGAANAHAPESKKFFGLPAASLFFKKELLALPYFRGILFHASSAAIL